MENPLKNFRIISICVIGIGAIMYYRGYSGRFGVEVTPLMSLLVASFGVCCLFCSFLPKVKNILNKKKYLFESEEVICQNCKSKYKTKHVQIPVCPKCDGKLVELKNN